MKSNAVLIAGAAVIATVILCCTLLVALDKLDGSLYIGAVIGPLIGAVVGVVGTTKGVQSGSQAAVDPPADA